MAKPGPAPKPTAMMEASGSWRTSTRQGEPRPQLGKPECPAHIKGKARRIWNELAEEIYGIGVLTGRDGLRLEQLAMATKVMRDMWEVMETEGTIAMSEKGSPYQHTCMTNWKSASDQVTKLSAQFGLSPTDRVGMVPAPRITAVEDKRKALLDG